MKGILVGSSDLKSFEDHRKELKENHDKRMLAINMITFSTKRPRIIKHGRAYIQLFGKKMYLSNDDVIIAKRAGYNVHYE